VRTFSQFARSAVHRRVRDERLLRPASLRRAHPEPGSRRHAGRNPRRRSVVIRGPFPVRSQQFALHRWPIAVIPLSYRCYIAGLPLLYRWLAAVILLAGGWPIAGGLLPWRPPVCACLAECRAVRRRTVHPFGGRDSITTCGSLAKWIEPLTKRIRRSGGYRLVGCHVRRQAP
jgi:hypothetical protein